MKIEKVVTVAIIIISLIPLMPSASASIVEKYRSTANTIIAADPPVTADTNNDGILDSLFIAGTKYGTTGIGIVLRINSSTGAEEWRREYTDADAYNDLNPIELYDVTGDGCPEVFTHFGAIDVGYQNGMICLNGLTGATVWENYNYRPAWHHFVIIADKVSNIPYIFYNDHSSKMVKVNARNGNLITEVTSGLSCNGGLSAADIDFDGDVDIILGLHSYPGFVCYNTDLVKQWDSNCATASSTQTTMLIDVTGPTVGVPDGTLDCVSLYQCSQGQTTAGLNVIDGASHQRVETMSCTNFYAKYGWPVSDHGRGSIADIDNDGYYEITTGSWGLAHIIRIKSPPELVATLTAFGTVGASAPRYHDILGLSTPDTPEIVCGGYALDGTTFQRITGIPTINTWSQMMNDIDDDGKLELFGSRNGQIVVYNTDKLAIPGLNTYTADYGYRRIGTEVVYEECPGTWWYSWDEWEADHQGQPLSCNAGGLYSNQIGQSIQFKGTATGGIQPYTWYWSFGDGTTGSGQNPTHTYSAAGTFTATLTVTDNNGETDTATQTVLINRPPSTPTVPSGPATRTISQTGTYSTSAMDPDNNLVQYRFDWNASGSHDISSWTTLGTPEHIDSLSHSWNTPGTYSVKAQSRDQYGYESGWSNGFAVTVSTGIETPDQQQPPVYGSPTPANGSANQPLSFTFSIPISDPNRDLISWTIQCSNGQVNSGTGVNGTRSLSLNRLAYSTTYKIWVNATDPTGSGLYTRRWYTFTTQQASSNQPPVLGTPSPANSSANRPLSFTFSIPINDPNGDLILWTIHSNNGQTKTRTGQTGGTYSMTLIGLTYSTTYTVWVNATDPTGSNQYTRRWYTYTTQGGGGGNQPPVYGSPTPANGSANQPLSFTFSIPISDPNKDLILWTIHSSNGQTKTRTGQTGGTYLMTLIGLTSGTTYKVWVNATDPTPGSGLYTRRSYTYTTQQT
jgi:PKD repeat protein